jgi:hypothetical protein
MDIKFRLQNLSFVLRLGKVLRTQLHDITVEPLPWNMIAALGKLRRRL